MKPHLVLTILLIFIGHSHDVLAQDFIMSDEGTHFTCGGNFYDSGGPNGNYSDGENYTITFCNEDFSSCIGLDFSSYNIEDFFDPITFYAGSTNNFPQISQLEGIGNNFQVYSTVNCITVQFTSDGIINNPGWESEIICTTCPTCDDGIMNGFETGVDCGGDCDPCPCADGSIDDIPVVISQSTCGMGSSFNFNNSCNNFNLGGQDITFDFTAESSGCYNFELSGLTAGTGIGLTVTQGCPDDPLSSCALSLSSFGDDVSGIMIAEEGEQYFVTVGSDGFGAACIDFNLSITEDCPPLSSADCFGAISVCQDIYTETEGPQGSGSFPNEFNPLGCNFSETNSYWYTFTVQENGDLSFILEPNNDTDDYDWALFDISEFGCENISNLPEMEVSCNSWGMVGVNGPTGISSAQGGIGNSNGPGDLNGPPFNADLPVEVGETYALCIMNWSNSFEGYDLNFGGSTASIFDDVPPEIVTITPNCASNEIEVVFSEPVLCTSLLAENFTITGPNGVEEVANVQAEDCSIGANSSQSVILVFNQSLDAGDYNLSGIGQDVVIDACENAIINDIDFLVEDGFSVDPVVVSPCVPGEGLIDISNYSGGVEPVSFFIDGIEDDDGIFENLEDGVYSVALIDANDCEFSLDLEVQSQALEIQLDGELSLCQLSTTIDFIAVGGEVEWGSTGGLSIIDIDDNSIEVSAENSGEYELTASINVDNCSVEESQIITLSAPIQADVEVNNSCTEGNGAIEVADLTGGLPPFSYSLDGNTQDAGLFNNLDLGVYNLEIVDALGCSFTDSYEVLVEEIQIDLGDDVEECELAASLEADINLGDIAWTSPDDLVFSNPTSTSTNVSASTSGTYTVTATVTSELCEEQSSILVTLSETIQLDIDVVDASCFGFCDGAIALDLQPEDLFVSIDGGLNFSQQNSYFNLCASSYPIIVRNDEGCERSQDVLLTEPPRIAADFKASPQPTQIPQTEIAFENLSENNVLTRWYFGFENASSNDENPVFTYPDDIGGVYLVSLAVEDEFGCVDSTTKRIVIEDDFQVYIPNAFSPNNDGLNDIFLPVLSAEPIIYELRIFNRWGQLIFETKDYNEPWLGQVSDGEHYVSPGVYVWTLSAGKSEIDAREYIGHITVLR